MIEVLVSFSSGVIVPIVLHYLNERKKKRTEKSKDVVISHLEIQNKNQQILDEIREELNADRVTLTKFANGTDFLDNTHMLNLTITGESNANGFDNLKQDFQKIPAYMFDRVLNMLKVEDYYIERNAELAQQDIISSIRKSYSVNTIVGIKIYSTKGKWIGILGVAWSKDVLISQNEIGGILIKSKQIH